ncbi:MAG: adenylate/guanylate cyclase domain-containing protein [candidate division FCPU426 bacterium]
MVSIRRHFQFQKLSKTRIAVYLAVLGGLIMATFDYFDFAKSVENRMLDMRFQIRGEIGPAADDEVVILAIDDLSMERLQMRWPWPRTMYAKVIDRLSQAGARVVALDLVFSELSESERKEQDKILGDAIIRSRSWIVLGSAFSAALTKHTDKMDIDAVKVTYTEALPDIDQTRAHVGYVNIWADKEDGVLRHASLLKTFQKKLYTAFDLKILTRFLKIDALGALRTPKRITYGPLRIPVDHRGDMLINYRGGPGNFKIISFYAVYGPRPDVHVYHTEEGEIADLFPGLLDAGVFKDKIVLIGPAFPEGQDYHQTPFTSSLGRTTGVEIHANILDTILKKRFLFPVPGWIKFALFLLLPLLIGQLTIKLKPIRGFVALVVLVAIYLLVAIWLFISYRWIVPVVNPLLATTLTFVMVVVYLLVTEERHNRFIKGMFSRYVSPKVVEELVKDPNAELKLGGNKQVVTVLFSDIRGFTTLSEELTPEAVVEKLNEYFQTWTDIIFKHDGTVDKFIGDAVMAIFGAPVAHLDDAARAVRAAWDMREALEKLNKRWQEQGRKTINIGVGINTGEAIVGNMGSHQAMGYTVIGDTVNLASRLESKTKDLSAFLLISESTYEAVKELVEVQSFSDITVKGKAKSISVFAVQGLKKA